MADLSAGTLALLGLASFAAGAVNAVAGGGTLITFSSLLGAGLDARIANATSTVALWPGSLGGAAAQYKDLRNSRDQLLLFGIPSLIGGTAGSLLLLYTPSATFKALVPWLILFATLLFAVRSRLSRWGKSSRLSEAWRRRLAWLFQLGVGVYGGYFGAGIGILMLAALSFMGEGNLNRANGIKNILAMLINGVAVAVFIGWHLVYWPAGLVMTAASIIGGYQGGHLSRRLGARFTQNFVIAVGAGMAAYTFWQQWAR